MLADRQTRAIFLDRDGVINHNRDDHVKTWKEFVFLPGALEAIKSLNQLRYRVFVITNQAVINRGMVPREVIEEIHANLHAAVSRVGGHIDEILYCPHRPEEYCGCRKPQPGLITDAAGRYGLDLSRSYVVGDTFGDIAAGQSAGCHAILVLTGRGPEQLARPDAHFFSGYTVAADLHDAAQLICAGDAPTATTPGGVPCRSPSCRGTR